jgi:transporter family-2 protein
MPFVYPNRNNELWDQEASQLWCANGGIIDMWGILIALLSGALMSIQGVFNTEVTKQTSLWVSTGWVQLSAFLVCVLAWIFTGRDAIAPLFQVENKYTLLGGVIGAFITITVIQSMGALGPAKAAMLIVVSQLAVAYLIELFGLFGMERQPLEWRKLLGMVVAIVGIIIFKWQK